MYVSILTTIKNKCCKRCLKLYICVYTHILSKTMFITKTNQVKYIYSFNIHNLIVKTYICNNKHVYTHVYIVYTHNIHMRIDIVYTCVYHPYTYVYTFKLINTCTS